MPAPQSECLSSQVLKQLHTKASCLTRSAMSSTRSRLACDTLFDPYCRSKATDIPDPIGFTDPDAVSKVNLHPFPSSYLFDSALTLRLRMLATTQKQSKKSSTTAVQRADPAALKMAKAWELAYSPAKSLPMNAIMLYMSGSGVQIFSMMAVGMLITGPIKGISTMNSGMFSDLMRNLVVGLF